METIKIYVACLKSYNKGDLRGEWFDLSEFSDKYELIEAIREKVLATNGEEYAVHDYDAPFPLGQLGGEHPDFEKLLDLQKALEDTPADVIVAGLALEIPLEEISERYRGEFDSEADIAWYLLDEGTLGDVDKDSVLYKYFDAESFGRDLFLSGDYAKNDVHVFAVY